VRDLPFLHTVESRLADVPSESQQVAAHLQDSDVIGRDFHDLVLGVEDRRETARAVLEAGIPKQFGRPALGARLYLDDFKLFAASDGIKGWRLSALASQTQTV
jgi:hypothetical protein